jgi:hypothetical protein
MAEFFKGDSEYVRNALVSVGATNITICQPQFRQVLYIRNSGATTITLHFGFGVAVANEGVVLAPGASYSESNSDAFVCYSGTINAIGDGAGGQLSIVER